MMTNSQINDIRKDVKTFIRACNHYMGDCNKYSVHITKSIEEINHLFYIILIHF